MVLLGSLALASHRGINLLDDALRGIAWITCVSNWPANHKIISPHLDGFRWSGEALMIVRR